MGERIDFPVNGSSCPGYYAPSAEGSGPGVLVIQEWWGLVPHIEEVCDRFAQAGFCALSPDLYRGETTTEPDEAGKLMMALNVDAASRDMDAAIDWLLARDEVNSSKVGVTGFCMGGGLALVVACNSPAKVGAVAPFYGLIPWEGAQPDFSAIEAPIRGHFAELDEFFGPEAARGLESQLRDLGKDASIRIHEGAEHAFFNDTRPEVHHAEASAVAWDETISFFRDELA
jgi:carboxymethylenebutenolidase